MSNTTNAVRQVLMNELGLTREVVREEMRKIVEAEAAKVTASLVSQGHLERFVREKFNEVARGNQWSQRAPILAIVEQAAKAEAEKFVRDNLRFVTPNVKVSSGAEESPRSAADSTSARP